MPWRAASDRAGGEPGGGAAAGVSFPECGSRLRSSFAFHPGVLRTEQRKKQKALVAARQHCWAGFEALVAPLLPLSPAPRPPPRTPKREAPGSAQRRACCPPRSSPVCIAQLRVTYSQGPSVRSPASSCHGAATWRPGGAIIVPSGGATRWCPRSSGRTAARPGQHQKHAGHQFLLESGYEMLRDWSSPGSPGMAGTGQRCHSHPWFHISGLHRLPSLGAT